MKKRAVLILIFFTSVFMFSCSSQQTGIVVAEFGQEQITYNEVKEAYNKNLSEDEKASADSLSKISDFLELYVNYKMKLRDAQIRGFENDPELIEEINSYIETVGVPYVEEKYVIEPGLREFYEKRKIEKRIKHILLRPDSTGLESAVKKAKDLLERIQNGESFEKLAYEHTEDEYSKPDSGDVYWLTVGQTVPEFDKAMYETSPGEVFPKPIETRYGVHLLKVIDEQPRKYEVKAQHILSSFNRGGEVDTAEALNTIKMVKDRLAEGESFSKLAEEFSTDVGSAQKGGDLGYFQRRMMVQPFDEAVFNLEVGEVSDIVESRFGYHIIKLNDIKETPPFEEIRNELKSNYQRSLYVAEKENFVNNLKQELSFKLNQSVWDSMSTGNSEYIIGDTYWESDLEKAYGDSTLFTIDGRDFKVNELMQELTEDKNYKIGRMTDAVMNKAFNEKIEEKLFAAKAFSLSKGDSEFAKLMDDYKKGLYIFELQEDEIWNKVSIDTTKILEYYEANKNEFIWPERVTYNVIYRPDSLRAQADLNAINDGGIPFEKVVESNSENSTLKSKTGIREKQVVTSSPLAEKAFNLEKEGDVSDVFKTADGWYIVKLIEKIPPTPKTFQEAENELLGLWQEKQTKELEQDYLNRLKALYEPEIYYDRLAEAHNKN